MNLNKLAFSGVVVGSIAAMGCGSTPSTTDSGTPQNDAFMETMAPVSVTYVVSEISAPSAPDGNVAPGFNLDEKVSDGTGTATCEDLVEDFVSPTGETGVDNQFTGQLAGLLGSLADVDIQMTIDQQIAEGGLLLALTVNDVNSFENDSSVTLDLAIVKPASCTEDSCPPAGGVVTADQAWATRTVISTGLAAAIVDGELRGTVPMLALSFDVGGSPISLTIRDATIGGDVTAEGMTNAAIGGVLRIDDIVTTLRSVPDLAMYADQAAMLLPTYADVEPTTADPTLCASISIGLGLEGQVGTLD